ncbi:MAG: NeuD/PglB/VioB family sugar acetyltransferase [Acidobacteriota bacterium]
MSVCFSNSCRPATSRLTIVGSGAQARYVIDIVERDGLAGIVDIDNRANVGKSRNGVPIFAVLTDFVRKVRPDQTEIVVAYGNNDRKRQIVEELAAHGFAFRNVISSLSFISSSATIGKGCIVNPFVAIMANANVGDHVIIHSHSIIEHDNQIGSFVNIAPGVSLAGRVSVGSGAYLFTGAKVIPDVVIGARAVIGAGAVVISEVLDDETVVGVPAKPLRRT